MIAHGDELGRTQQGNNNTYAQDSELSWVDWERADLPLMEFTAAVSRLRAAHPTFRRKRFFTGRTVRTGSAEEGGERLNDIVWLHPDGHAMENEAWDQGGQAIGMYLNGDGIAGKGARGETITDDHFLLYFNGGDEIEVTLPPEEYAASWDVVIDTGGNADDAPVITAGASRKMATHSLVVLREHTAPEAEPDHSVAASVAAQSGAPASASSGSGRRRG